MLEVLGSSWPLIIAMGVLLLGSAFFSSAETAVFSLGWADLKKLGDPESHLVKRLKALLSDRRSLLVTILLGNLVVNILYFNFGALLTSRLLASGATIAGLLTPLLVLAVIVLFGEVLPKTLAVSWPGAVARMAAEPLWWLQRVLTPPRVVLSAIANAVGRLLMGPRPEEGDFDPQELHELLSLAAQEGHLATDEHEALQGVLVLSSMPVKEIMSPRVKISAFRMRDDEAPAASRARFLKEVRESRHNKLPVYHESLDVIEGYLEVKAVLTRPKVPLAQLIREVGFIPESASVASAMQSLRKTKVRLMVVVDEYGGTEGLVTHEDLVEAVVGDLRDEGDQASAEVVEIGDGTYEVQAGLGVHALKRLMGPLSEALPVSTIGGLVTMKLGRLPIVGDRVEIGRVGFEVVTVRKHRPGRVRIRTLSRRQTTTRIRPRGLKS